RAASAIRRLPCGKLPARMPPRLQFHARPVRVRGRGGLEAASCRQRLLRSAACLHEYDVVRLGKRRHSEHEWIPPSRALVIGEVKIERLRWGGEGGYPDVGSVVQDEILRIKRIPKPLHLVAGGKESARYRPVTVEPQQHK